MKQRVTATSWLPNARNALASEARRAFSGADASGQGIRREDQPLVVMASFWRLEHLQKDALQIGAVLRGNPRQPAVELRRER
jgi:hypothetical protein